MLGKGRCHKKMKEVGQATLRDSVTYQTRSVSFVSRGWERIAKDCVTKHDIV